MRGQVLCYKFGVYGTSSRKSTKKKIVIDNKSPLWATRDLSLVFFPVFIFRVFNFLVFFHWFRLLKQLSVIWAYATDI